MASFKFLEALCSKILICLYIYIWHLKIFLLYLLRRGVVEVLTINKFLAYITKKKIP